MPTFLEDWDLETNTYKMGLIDLHFITLSGLDSISIYDPCIKVDTLVIFFFYLHSIPKKGNTTLLGSSFATSLRTLASERLLLRLVERKGFLKKRKKRMKMNSQ